MTLKVSLTDPPCKDVHSQFTTVTLKAMSGQM